MTSPVPPAPSHKRVRIALAMGALGTMLDVALVVFGSALLGLAIAVILDGFDLVTIGLDLSTGAMLGSGLVIAIVGGFALGVASEGPLGRNRRLIGFDEVHVLVARFGAAILIGLLFLLVRNLIGDFTDELPRPFQIGVDTLRAVGIASLTTVPLLAVPLAWWARSGGLGEAVATDGDIPVLYLVWAVTTMIQL